MSISLNRKNIALALAAWRLSKSLREMFGEPEPEPEPPKRKLKIAVVGLGAIAALGAIVLWRSR